MPASNQTVDPTGTHLADSAIVFLFAWFVRTIHTWCMSAAPFFAYKVGDAQRYDLWARDIAGGNWIGTEIFYQAPLYPYFLATIYTFIGNSVESVRSVQVLLGAASCVFLMNAAKNLFSRKAGLVTGVLMALYAPSIFLEGLIQKSILDLFFISIIIWLCTKTLSSDLKRWWLWLGVALGLIALTRENALILIPVVILWAVFRTPADAEKYEDVEGRLGSCISLALGLALILSPVALRNFHVGGELHLTTSQLGPNFYIGNNPTADGTYRPLKAGRGDARYEQQDAIDIAEAAVGRKLSPKEVSDYYLGESLTYIKSDPAGWLKLLGKKTLLMVNATETVDTEDQYTYASWSLPLKITGMIFHFGTLFPLGIIGIWLTREKWKQAWWAYLMLAAFAASVIGFFVFGRYRFPLVPLLMIFAGPGLVALYEMWKAGKARQVLACAPVLVAIAVVCGIPMVDKDQASSITYSNFGKEALVRNEVALSEEFFRKALEIKPDNFVAHNNLGVLYWKRKLDPETAKRCFQKAIELKPDFDSAKSRLEKLQQEMKAHQPKVVLPKYIRN